MRIKREFDSGKNLYVPSKLINNGFGQGLPWNSLKDGSVNEILKCLSDAFRIKDISIRETEIEEIVKKLYESV